MQSSHLFISGLGVFMAQSFCPVESWNLLPFHCWLFCSVFFISGKGRWFLFKFSFWGLKRCFILSEWWNAGIYGWGEQLIEHYEQGCKGLKITWGKATNTMVGWGWAKTQVDVALSTLLFGRHLYMLMRAVKLVSRA